jgi:hypothetical protein
MDVWIELSEDNAEKAASVLREFGMPEDEVTKELFLEKGKIVRMGLPPVRIEVITGISGVSFQDCFSRRVVVQMDDLTVSMISLEDLKLNKKASGRHKDLEDLEHLS